MRNSAHARKLALTILAALTMTLAACQSDTLPTDDTTVRLLPDGRIQLDIAAGLDTPHRAATRGEIGELPADGTIQGGLTVAVFGQAGGLLEQAEATPVTDGVAGSPGGDLRPSQDGRYHFRLTLHGTDGATKLHFVAGTHNGITPGTEGNIMGNLTTDATRDDNGNYHFPDAYWQRVELADGIDPDDTEALTAALSDLTLVRNSVKITLDVAPQVTNFTLTGYELVRVPLRTHTALYHDGQFIAPYQSLSYEEVKARYGGGGWTNPTYLVSIPTDQQADQGKPDCVYKANEYYLSASPRYMYQRSVVSNTTPTYLIAKGQYTPQGGAAVTCYYKINLAEQENQTLMPLYRNFEYKFTITSVEAKGQDTPYLASQTSGTGALNITSVTHYDSQTPAGDGRLELGWTEQTFTPEEYQQITQQNAGYATLPAQYIETANSVAHNERIYITDEHNSVIWAGNSSNVTMADGSATKAVGDEISVSGGSVFDKLKVNAGDIQLHLIAPPANGVYKQTFHVCIKDSDGQVYTREITVYALGQVTLQITATNTTDHTNIVPTGLNQPVTVTVKLPEALPSSLFPLPLYLYIPNHSLSPVAGENLSVGVGAVQGGNTGTYFFKYMLSNDEYKNLSVSAGLKSKAFSFVTSKENSGSTVGVSSDKISAAWCEFKNPKASGTLQFTNVSLPGIADVAPALGADFTLQFTTSSITTVHVILPPGVEPASDYMTRNTSLDLSSYPSGSTAYNLYSVSAGTHTVPLRTAAGYPQTDGQTARIYVQSDDYAQDGSVGLKFVGDGSTTTSSFTFNRNNFSNAKPSIQEINGVKASLSAGRPQNNYTEMRHYDSDWIGTNDDKITISSSSHTITNIHFTMERNQLGVQCDTGTITGDTGTSPTWSGLTKQVTFSGSESQYNQSNRFSSMVVTTLYKSFEQVP